MAILSLSLSLLGAEVLLRQIVPLDLGSSFLYRIPHPVLGWVLTPQVSYRHHIDETLVSVTYNSYGWRDTEHSLEKPSSTFRVLVLGDSFMEAYSVDLHATFSSRIAQLAEERGLSLEVINLGVGGYGTLQEYLAFQEIGQSYQPDLVVLGFYVANDIRNNSMTLETQLKPGSLKVTSRPFLDPNALPNWHITQVDFAGAQRRYAAGYAKQNTVWRKLARHSAVAYASEKAATRLTQMLTPSSQRSSQNRPPTSQVKHQRKAFAKHGVHYCQEPAEYSQAWTLTEHILVRLKHDVESIGSRLIVFSVPALHEVSPSVMAAVQAEVPQPELLCLERVPGHARLRQLLTTLQIDFVDLLPAFRSATREQNKTLFWTSDRHWNPAGHELAAQQVMKALAEKHLLPLH